MRPLVYHGCGARHGRAKRLSLVRTVGRGNITYLRVDLRDLPDDIDFASRPVFTPTFVLVEDGKELGRMEGYAGDEFFWFVLGKLLDENEIKAPGDS